MDFIYAGALVLMTALFLSSDHPLVMGFILMALSCVYGTSAYFFMKTPWLGYLLVMIFLSGMMIIFIYMASLSSNEPMKMKFKPVVVFLLVLVAAAFLFSAANINCSDYNELKNNLTSSTLSVLFKSYGPLLSDMSFIMILYLLVVLVSAMKIIVLDKGPLRSKK